MNTLITSASIGLKDNSNDRLLDLNTEKPKNAQVQFAKYFNDTLNQNYTQKYSDQTSNAKLKNEMRSAKVLELNADNNTLQNLNFDDLPEEIKEELKLNLGIQKEQSESNTNTDENSTDSQNLKTINLITTENMNENSIKPEIPFVLDENQNIQNVNMNDIFQQNVSNIWSGNGTGKTIAENTKLNILTKALTHLNFENMAQTKNISFDNAKNSTPAFKEQTPFIDANNSNIPDEDKSLLKNNTQPETQNSNNQNQQLKESKGLNESLNVKSDENFIKENKNQPFTSGKVDNPQSRNLNLITEKDPTGEIQNLINKFSDFDKISAKISSRNSNRNDLNFGKVIKDFDNKIKTSFAKNQELEPSIFKNDVKSQNRIESETQNKISTNQKTENRLESLKIDNKVEVQFKDIPKEEKVETKLSQDQTKAKTDKINLKEVKSENQNHEKNFNQDNPKNNEAKAKSNVETKQSFEISDKISQNQTTINKTDGNVEFKILNTANKLNSHDSGFQNVEKSFETENSTPKNTPWNINEKDVVSQVLKKVTLNIKGKSNEFFMKLEPDFLGSVRFRVQLEDGKMTARVFTDTEMAKDVLEKNVHMLTNGLSEQGIKVEKFHVEVSNTNQTEGFANSHENNSRNQEQENEIFKQYPKNEFNQNDSTQDEDESFNHSFYNRSNERTLIDIRI